MSRTRRSRFRSRAKWGAAALAAALTATLSGGTPVHAMAEGVPAADGDYRFLAKVDFGISRSCTGALIDARWVITAATCFAEGGVPATAGPPRQPSKATIGRTDLSRATGHVVPIVELVPHPDRDVVLAKLGSRVSDIPPITIGTTPPVSDEVLRVAGYGRTSTVWVPDRPHTALFAVQSLTATTVAITAHTPPGASICKGDAGGPAFRQSGGRVELVALNHTSWQRGCLAESETREGAIETRVDDIAAWIDEKRRSHCDRDPTGTAGPETSAGRPGDFTGDGKTDLMAQYSTGVLRVWASTGDLSADLKFAGATAQVGSGWVPTNVQRIITGDFTGDCKTDVMAQYSNGQLRALSSTGDLSANNKLLAGGSTGVLVGTGWVPTNVQRIVTGDFTGDGKTDLMAQYSTGVLRVWASTGDLSADLKFAGATAQVGSGWVPTNVQRIITGDFTGDGKTDVMAQYSNGQLRAWSSTGDLSANNKLLAGGSTGVLVGTGWVPTNVQRIIAGDFTGDGKTDLMAQYSTGALRVWASTGDLSADLKFAGATAQVGSGWVPTNVQRIITGDFTGDGKTDIMAQYSNGQLRGWPSTGDLSATNKLFSGGSTGVLVGSGWVPTNVQRIG